MSEENRLACDLLVKNARIFDGATLREGLSIGVTGDRISFVANSAASSRTRDRCRRTISDAGTDRLSHSSAQYVDRER